mgnify:CR=1 FL=1
MLTKAAAAKRATIAKAIKRDKKVALQHAPLVPVLAKFLASRAKTVDLPYTYVSMTQGMPEFDSKTVDKVLTYTWNTFTTKQVLECLEAFMTYMPTTGPKPVTSKIPSYASTRKHFAEIMALTYTPSKGQYADVECNGFFSVMANFRFTYRKTVAASELSAVVSAGEGFFAEGVLDKDGVARPYGSAKKAAKAYARSAPVLKVTKAGKVCVPNVRVGGGWGSEWHEGAFGMSKKDILKEAATHVYAQADALGKGGQQASNSYTMQMVEGMSWQAIVRLARANGSDATKKAPALMYIQDNFGSLDFTSL